MGKADMDRDYYADLELQPTADLAEIKKQFKKLALKWHPDRNPGKESEVNARFQTIQSAHEILSDEAERRRYDAGRIRVNRFSSSTTGGTRGNPYANAGSQWAPPPKPFGTPRASAAGQSTSGADRYQKFKTEASFRSTPNRPQDQETKKSNYEAFERMKKNHPTGTFAKTAGTTQYGRWKPSGPPRVPDPRYTPQSGREESNNQKHAPPPKPTRPGYEEWNAGEMHGRQSPKKSGFMPGNPGGDEPPAPTASSAYFNSRTTRASTARQSTAPEPPPRPSGTFETFRDSTESIDGAARQSTPYAGHGGEKTNPFETSGINRSKSTREQTTTNGHASAWEAHRRAGSSSSGSARDKHRSVSPPRSRNFREQPPAFGATAGSPPKRDYSHINASPPISGASNKARGTPRSNARFQATALSDTSSEDEDSDIQPTTTKHPSSKKLPRRKVPTQDDAHITPGTNVASDQYRKPSLAEFRKMFKSGDPMLNKLCSGSAGNQNSSNAASQPMYEQGSHRPLFQNIPSPPLPSFYTQFQHQNSQSFSKVQSLPDELENQTAQVRINKQKRARFTPNDRSSAVGNPASSPHSPWHTDNTSNASSPSRADDLSNFEQSIMGDLHRTFVQDTSSSSHNAAQGTGGERRHSVMFGQSSQLGSGRPGSPPFGKISTNHGSRDLPSHATSSRSPKRKVGVYDSNVYSSAGAPRKIADFYDGLNKYESSSTNPINYRFPAAYTSEPSSAPLFTANDAESINTRFETKNWDGKFRAASFVNPTGFSNGASRPQAASRSGRRSPIKRTTGRTRSASASADSQSTLSEPQPSSQPMESPVSKTFAPEEWSAPEMFKTSTFAPPTPRASSRPPPFSRTPSRKGSRVKASHVNKTAGGQAAVVQDDSSDSDVASFDWPNSNVNGTAAPTGPSSPNAMDIDSPDEASGQPPKSAEQARNVPVELVRPEWRASATNGNFNSSKQNLDDLDDFKTNLDDLKNVEPLFQPAQGLNSVNDLKSSLPFQSTASNAIPLEPEATRPFNIQIPNPPLAPKVPSKPMDGTQRMSPASWQSYLLAFKAYLTDYQLYNERIECHFKTRRDVFNGLRAQVGWAWLESKGDELFEAQMAEVRQDTLVREKWAEAGRSHEAAMEQFRSVRAVMKGNITV